MIERVTQTREFQASKYVPVYLTFNFPRASLLEYEFRVKPQELKPNPEDCTAGLQFAFGVGNPPDFGLGSDQTVIARLPATIVPISQWEGKLHAAENELAAAEAQLKADETALGTPGLGGAGLLQQLAFAAEAYAKGSVEERLTNLGKAVSEAQAAVAAQEATIGLAKGTISTIKAAIAQLHVEQPTGWTPLVMGSYARSFNAVRALVLPPRTLFNVTFTLELTLSISRPEDTGPTYTQPFATAGGG
jgi:hypothetical protein